MILERIGAAGFRAFAERMEFTPDARFTVIAAPNGTGKSTLLDALYFGLLERHTVSGVSAEGRFKSIGRDLAPSIEIDFAVDGARYRLRKVFLSSAKSCALQRMESGRYIAFKDGSAADDFVRTLFFAEAPGRGALDTNRNLGFAHILWSPARASFVGVPDGAGNEIRAMLGGAALAVTPGERAVQQRATAEYLRYFTEKDAPTTRAGSVNIPALAERLAAARTAEIEARQACARLDRLAVAYTDSAAEAARMVELRDSLRADIERAKSAVKVFNDLTAAVERAARTEAESRSAYEHCAGRLHELERLRAERELLARDRAECSHELEKTLAAAAHLADRLRLSRQAVEDAGAALAEIGRRAATVTAARTYVDSLAAAAGLEALIVAHDRAKQTLADLTQSRSSIVAPSRAELEALRFAGAELDTLQATIAASALTLEIDAERDLGVNVVTGDGVGTRMLVAGTSTTFTATNSAVVIDVPGIGRIRAHGTDGAAKARKKLQPLIDRRDAARDRFGTSEIVELALRLERAESIESTIVQTRGALEVLLSGQTISHLREALAEAGARISTIENEQPGWRGDPPEAIALRAAFDLDFQAATDASKQAQIEFQAVEKPKLQLDAEIAALRTRDFACAIKLDANDAARVSIQADGLDDNARIERAAELAVAWHAATSVTAETRLRLAGFRDDPRELLAGLERTEREAGAAYEHALAEAEGCRTQLDTQMSLGSYAKLAQAEEHLAVCESDLRTAQRQAAAIARVHEAFERIRARRVAAVVEPVTVASTRYLTRIVGSPMGKIDIGEGLAPSGLIETVSRMRLAIDGTLSTGEKEQIYLATRLALAEIIAKQRGRQLFVVDDALTATDPNRLRRFIAILEELSRERLQVIVTTADRSRYLGINGAKHVDLAAALLGESAA